MTPTIRVIFLAALLFWPILAASTDFAHSQSRTGGCNLEQIGGTGRYIVRCRDGLSITAEKGASYQLLDRDSNGDVDAVRLGNKAVLVDVPEGRPGRRFEVIAPQAIAAVRGTQWAVDASPGKTSVFVARGEVGVRKRTSSASVTLGAGEGVDVEAGKPLTVRQWKRARVNALMSRLGQ
jgi:hypothetical protein